MLLSGCLVMPPQKTGESQGVAFKGRSSDAAMARNLSDRTLTVEALQLEILSYSGRFLTAFAEAVDRSLAEETDPQARVLLRQLKLGLVSSAVAIAIERYPLQGLREYLVLTELAYLVWESGGFPEVAPESRESIARALAELREQLQPIAARALSQTSIDTIKELAKEWRDKHPNRRYVAFVRFSQLGDRAERRDVDREIRRGGLLAPIEDVVRELDELRLISERAIFLASIMPTLIEWQADLFVDRSLAAPEVQMLLGNLDAFNRSAALLESDFSSLIEILPQERETAIKSLAEAIALERRATLADVDATLRGITADLARKLERSSDSLTPLTTQLASLAADIRGALELVDSMGGEADDSSDDPVDINASLEEATLLAESATTLALAIDSLLAQEQKSATLARLEELGHSLIKRLFLYASALTLLVTVCGVASVLILRKRRAA
jgi:hypothetical protein